MNQYVEHLVCTFYEPKEFSYLAFVVWIHEFVSIVCKSHKLHIFSHYFNSIHPVQHPAIPYSFFSQAENIYYFLLRSCIAASFFPNIAKDNFNPYISKSSDRFHSFNTLFAGLFVISWVWSSLGFWVDFGTYKLGWLEV